METVEFLAAFKPPIRVGKGNEVEISRLAGYPLLLAETGLASRRAFDAACRAAGVEPNVVFESRTPHTSWRWPSKGTAWPLFRQPYRSIATRFASLV